MYKEFFFSILFLSQFSIGRGEITFTPVAKESLGIDSLLGSPSWVDYNQDGLVDFYSGVAYINNGDGTFTRLPSSRWNGGRVLCFGDYDNDGYPDILTTKHNGDTCFILLYKNSGPPDYELVDVSQEAGLGYPLIEPALGNDVAWLDYDNDSHLDFYLSNYEEPMGVGHRDYLFHNKGDGTFENVSIPSKIGMLKLCSRGVSCADFDDDGDMDIFVSVYRLQPNILWQNNGDGTFTNVAKEKGVIGLYISFYYGHNIGACWGDYNNDGYLDLFSPITHHPTYPGDSTHHLWRNNGPPDYDFTDEIASTGIRKCEIGSAPSWADYDNDGDLDLYFVNLYGFPRALGWLYRNNGDGTFTNVTRDVGLPYPGRIDYALWADFNQDGFLDVYLPGYDFYINNGNGNHWIEVDLKGRESNRTAIGARIKVYTDTLLVVREVAPNAGNGYGSPFLALQHFGLGKHTEIDSLIIHWPSGRVEKYKDLPVDTIFSFTEGETGGLEEVDRRWDEILSVTSNPFDKQIVIILQLPATTGVDLRIYDAKGEMVKTLIKGQNLRPGTYTLRWDGKRSPSGVYFLKLSFKGRVITEKLILVK